MTDQPARVTPGEIRVGRHVRIPVSALWEFIESGTVEPVSTQPGQGTA